MAKKPVPSYLAAIDAAGARAEFDALLAEFVVGDDQQATASLLAAIDANGLRSDATMRAVSVLQRQLIVKPTLYTKLAKLAVKYGLKPLEHQREKPRRER